MGQIVRMVLAVAGLTASGAAAAQSVGGPPIGPVKGFKTGDEVVLVYPDGIGLGDE